MEIYLTDSLIVEAAGCIVGLRTESAIVTGGRVLTVIKVVVRRIVYYPVPLESGFYSMQRRESGLTEKQRTRRVMPCYISTRSHPFAGSVRTSTVKVCGTGPILSTTSAYTCTWITW